MRTKNCYICGEIMQVIDSKMMYCSIKCRNRAFQGQYKKTGECLNCGREFIFFSKGEYKKYCSEYCRMAYSENKAKLKYKNKIYNFKNKNED